MSVVEEDGKLLGTIELLEHRMQRIEFVLSGNDTPQEILQRTALQGKGQAVPAKLDHLETALRNLSFNSNSARDMLNLYTSHPDIFPLASPGSDLSTFSQSERLSIVNSYASLYASTASQLTSIQDVPIPPAEASVSLISLHSRLARVKHLQDIQGGEIADLRLRTVSLLQRWYEIGVLGEGECWMEWEDRVVVAEKAMRRNEAAILRDSIAL